MENLLPFLGILGGLLLGVMSPGPSFVLVVRTAARDRRDGFAAALGMGVGGVVFALLALGGLRAVLAAVPWLYAALKVVGGLYLLWLAWSLWRGARRGLDVEASPGGNPESARRAFAFALATQLTNPKTAVFYGSVFAALLPPRFSPWWFLALPPLVFVLEAGWYAVVAALLSSRGPRAAYLRFKGAVDRAAGAVIGLLGLRLLWEAR